MKRRAFVVFAATSAAALALAPEMLSAEDLKEVELEVRGMT